MKMKKKQSIFTNFIDFKIIFCNSNFVNILYKGNSTYASICQIYILNYS